VLERVRPGGPVIANVPLVDPAALRADLVVQPVDAAALAKEAGAPQAIGFVLLGAYVAVTGLVPQDSLVAAMEELLPPYRRQHAPANARALAAGASLTTAVARGS
jgi:2-oxoglutarate ferredoxin oxidoreductase subunit gamma